MEAASQTSRRLTGKDYGILAALALLALFIWLRDVSWMSSAEDTLPILIALPLFWWLGRPWHLLDEKPLEFSTGSLVGIVFLFLFGIVGESTLSLALGWTWLLWTWLKNRTDAGDHSSIKKLLVLPILSFPWITLDLQQLGWYFRISGAWVAAQFFTLFGYNVKYAGTTLLVEHMPISVEVACAGLNTLQSMLIAGAIVAYILLGRTGRYWPNLIFLFVMAWAANTSRIIVLSFVALLFGREYALGAFHTWGGWFILVVMFGLSWLFFEMQAPKQPTSGEKG